MVYKASITTNSETNEYIGSAGGSYVIWYAHISNIKTEKNNGTELSKHAWKLKNKNINYEIKWDIIHKIGKIMNISKVCEKGNLEKMEIA